MTPIETKQESVRSYHRRGSYERMGWRQHVRSKSANGRVGRLDRSNSPNVLVGRLRSVQLAKWASWTACSVQLAKWTSWMACSVLFSCLVGWTLVYRCPGSVVRGLERSSLKTYLVNTFRTCYETWFSSFASLFFWELSFLFWRRRFSGSFWLWFRRNRFWPQQLAPQLVRIMVIWQAVWTCRVS